MTSERLAGKTAVITGGSRGIGYAIAETFADAGADLFIVARDKAELERARQGLLKLDVSVDVLSADLSTSNGVDSVVQTVTDRATTVDILANVAGKTHFEPVSEATVSAFDELVDLNLKAPFRLIQGLLPLLKDGGGSIINISSYWAKKMVPDRPSSIHSMTQGGTNALTLALASELGEKGVRVNAIAPGAVRTDGFEAVLDDMGDQERVGYDTYIQQAYPLGRLGQPNDVAAAALFLAADESQWVTGEIMSVDGGLTVR